MAPLRGVLVPLDGSALAEQALLPAALLAKAARTRLRLMMVHEVLPAPQTREEAKLYTSIEVATRRASRDYLQRQQKWVERKGCDSASHVVITGKPGPGIVEHAGEWGASVIVMCTHGRGAIERAWLGSVADHVVRNSRIPVLLMRARAEGVAELAPGGQVLVPLDGSAFGEAALGPAAELAQLLGAELRLVHVVRPVQVAVSGTLSLGVGYDDVLLEAWQQQAREYLEGTVARLRSQGHRVVSEIVINPSVTGAILDVAGSEHPRLVAMATHGRGGMSRLFLGGVADKVVRGANCPVLVCPAAKVVRRKVKRPAAKRRRAVR